MKITVFGASGLVGSHLVRLIQNDMQVDQIILANRRKLDLNYLKVKQEIIDFNRLDDYPELFNSDQIFICLGTTIKKAGSKAAFERVDLEIPHQIAKLAKAGKCKRILMISSMGANADASNFYLKTKGRAEEAVKKDGPESIVFLRPALLLGDREEFRFGERIAQVLMPLFSFLMIGPLMKYRAISAKRVAQAMKKLAKEDDPARVIESDQLIKMTNEDQ